MLVEENSSLINMSKYVYWRLYEILKWLWGKGHITEALPLTDCTYFLEENNYILNTGLMTIMEVNYIIQEMPGHNKWNIWAFFHSNIFFWFILVQHPAVLRLTPGYVLINYSSWSSGNQLCPEDRTQATLVQGKLFYLLYYLASHSTFCLKDFSNVLFLGKVTYYGKEVCQKYMRYSFLFCWEICFHLPESKD